MSKKPKIKDTLNDDTLNDLLEVISADQKPINIIVTQVDPDAIGAATGLKWILTSLRSNITVRLFYCGGIGCTQNQAIFDRLNLKKEFLPIAEMPNIVSEGEYFALVDSSSTNDVRLPEFLRGLKPSIIIDHHRNDKLEVAELSFVLIDENEVGSASTLVTELIMNSSLLLSFNQEKKLSTLLQLGIYNDTSKMECAGIRDHESYAYLTKVTDRTLFNRLNSFQLPAIYFQHFRNALNNMQINGSRMVAYIGFAEKEYGDHISIIANELIRHEGISIVVVWTVIDESVRISARSADSSTVGLNDFLHKCFGAKAGAKVTPDGHGEGGGLLNLGLGEWLTENNKGDALTVIQKSIAEKIFQS